MASSLTVRVSEDMLKCRKLNGLFLKLPLNAALSTKPKTNDLETDPPKTLFIYGWVSSWDDKTVAIDSSNRIDGWTFFQRHFASQRYTWVDFHFTYFKIGFTLK